MDRANHYEAAIEAYLQWHRLCYVAVDETRRAFLGDAPVKNLDFIVCSEQAHLLVDVKGRRFPAGSPDRPRRVWECWTRHEDIDGLLRWQALFGPDYVSLLLFTYLLAPEKPLPEAEAEWREEKDLWTWRGRRYLLRAITVEDYQQHMRTRSPKWETVALPGAVFRALARPFHEFTQHTAHRNN